jgi:hypothetical protein
MNLKEAIEYLLTLDDGWSKAALTSILTQVKVGSDSEPAIIITAEVFQRTKQEQVDRLSDL